MNLKNIPLDFADKLTIVGERLNDSISRDMGLAEMEEAYFIVTDIIAPLTFNYRDIETIIKDDFKKFENYSLRSYTFDKLEKAWDKLIPQSIKDELLKINNGLVLGVVNGEHYNWNEAEWVSDICEELETKIVTLIGARYYSYFYKENRYKLEPLLDKALEIMKRYQYKDYIEAVQKVVDKEVRAYKYGD